MCFKNITRRFQLLRYVTNDAIVAVNKHSIWGYCEKSRASGKRKKTRLCRSFARFLSRPTSRATGNESLLTGLCYKWLRPTVVPTDALRSYAVERELFRGSWFDLLKPYLNNNAVGMFLETIFSFVAPLQSTELRRGCRCENRRQVKMLVSQRILFTPHAL